jgi:Divergent InlB B-repeat domain
MLTSSRTPGPITANARGFGYLVFVLVSAASAAVACGGSDITTPQVTLSVALAGNGRGTVTSSVGGINCTNASGSASGTCQAGMNKNTEVTLSASAEAGSSFAGWSGNGVSCDAGAPCTITADADRSVTATFNGAAATQTLTVVGGGTGTGSGHVVSDPAGIDCDITSGVAGATGCSASFDTGAAVQLVESGNLVGWGGACGGTTCSVAMTEARTIIATFGPDVQATKLGFVGQPSGVQVGNVITPAVQVAIQDANGQTVTSRSDPITLQIGANTGNATLGGKLTQNAVNGVATFSDLTLSAKGDNYTLVASSDQLPSANSSPFSVSDVPVAQLVFKVPPSNTQAGAPFNPTVTVEIQDQSHAVLTTRTDVIILSLQNNPGAATLSGNAATAVAGVATFPNLMMTKAGTGYTLAAATGNASGAVSTAFDIAAGPPFIMARNAAETRSAPAGTAVNTADRPSVKILDAFSNPVKDVLVDWKVTVDAGGGQVDPASRSTGPLGVSIVSSWTLGNEVGTDNNQLEASRAGLIGSPVTFKASGTIPPGKGVFTGILKTISNTGVFGNSISDADLVFTTPPGGTPAGTTKSRSDGSFTSPPLPAGSQFRIAASRVGLKTITFEKPSLTAGAQFDLRTLGMVTGSTESGTAGFAFTVKLKDLPDQSSVVRVEVYRGYYVGESDQGPVCGPSDATECSPGTATANILESNTEISKDENGIVVSDSALVRIDQLGDWGPLTVRVIVAGYKSEERLLVVDSPVGFRFDCEDPNFHLPDAPPPADCVKPFELDPTP